MIYFSSCFIMFPNDNKCARARPKKLALSAISDVGEKGQLWRVGCARTVQENANRAILVFQKKEIRMVLARWRWEARE